MHHELSPTTSSTPRARVTGLVSGAFSGLGRTSTGGGRRCNPTPLQICEVNSEPMQNGWSALMEAAEGGHLEVVRLLLRRGAHTDFADKVS